VRSESRNLLRNFLTEIYSSLVVEEGALLEVGDELFALPDEAPEPRGMRFLRPGVWLGTVRRGRFEPAHALVMALPASLASNRLDLALEDPRVGAYLMGHPLDAPGESGWIPVCVEGYALGWGKRVGATVKNHYPKGLRWR
jgi:NOL1/NOP2/fmu family ribosome biogenesis protein